MRLSRGAFALMASVAISISSPVIAGSSMIILMITRILMTSRSTKVL